MPASGAAKYISGRTKFRHSLIGSSQKFNDETHQRRGRRRSRQDDKRYRAYLIRESSRCRAITHHRSQREMCLRTTMVSEIRKNPKDRKNTTCGGNKKKKKKKKEKKRKKERKKEKRDEREGKPLFVNSAWSHIFFLSLFIFLFFLFFFSLVLYLGGGGQEWG